MRNTFKSIVRGALCAGLAATALAGNAWAGPINMASPRGIETPSLTDQIYYRRYNRGATIAVDMIRARLRLQRRRWACSALPQLAPVRTTRIITVIPPMATRLMGIPMATDGNLIAVGFAISAAAVSLTTAAVEPLPPDPCQSDIRHSRRAAYPPRLTPPSLLRARSFSLLLPGAGRDFNYCVPIMLDLRIRNAFAANIALAVPS